MQLTVILVAALLAGAYAIPWVAYYCTGDKDLDPPVLMLVNWAEGGGATVNYRTKGDNNDADEPADSLGRPISSVDVDWARVYLQRMHREEGPWYFATYPMADRYCKAEVTQNG